jgi:chromosome segregation ATPase
MKPKVIIIVLAVLAAVLAIALFAVKNQDNADLGKAADTITSFSNQLATAQDKVTELDQVNLKLTNDLAQTQQQVAQLSSDLAVASNSLATTTAALNTTKASLDSTQQQVTNLDDRIADLESQNKVLDDRSTQLNATITQLNDQIAETRKELSESQTNNAFLTAELQKQLALKAELERKFNNLDEVRAQVKKLRDEAFVARRLELMKTSATERKGAELLVQRVAETNTPGAKMPPHYDLNVEVGSDGSVRVISPLQSTNAPKK